MKKTTTGFTIVELLVIVAVIGILAAIGTLAFFGIQVNTRDSQRSSQATVVAEALEKYYDANGEYPSCNTLQTVAGATGALSGLDPKVLVTPKATSGTTDSISCADLVNGSTSDVFSYTGNAGYNCTSQNCPEWTIKYLDESDNTVKTIVSRHKVSTVALSNITNLVATANGFTQINLTWSSVTNAISYQVQQASDNAFTTNVTQLATVTTNSTSVTGLTGGTTYYFRVAPSATNGQGNWSNIANATTQHLATPIATTRIDSATQITLSWGAISQAQSYTVQRSTSSDLSSPTTVTGVTATSYAFTGLIQGMTYYFQVDAVTTGDTSDWSDIVTDDTFINTPATPTFTVPTTNGGTASGNNDDAVWNWNPITCPTGSSIHYRFQYSYNMNPTYLSDWYYYDGDGNGNTGDVDLPTTGQGYTYTMYTQSGCTNDTTGISSNWSNSSYASYRRIVNTPAAPGFSVKRESLTGTGYTGFVTMVVTSSCSAGITLDSQSDPYMGGYSWSGTSISGWYHDAYGHWFNQNHAISVWNPGIPFGESVTTTRTGGFASGTKWGITVNLRCRNPTTGIVSNTVTGSTTTLNLP